MSWSTESQVDRIELTKLTNLTSCGSSRLWAVSAIWGCFQGSVAGSAGRPGGTSRTATEVVGERLVPYAGGRHGEDDELGEVDSPKFRFCLEGILHRLCGSSLPGV